MISQTSELVIILLSVFFLSFVGLLYYYLVIFSKLAFYKPKGQIDPVGIPVTIVITAKNEEENLQRNLPHVLSQDYPEFEVIVVNDFSDDDTGPVLEEFQRRYKNFRAITIKQEGSHAPGKKYPLTLGIKGAKYEIVLLTDADCRPKSKDWISTIVRNYKPGTEIVLGYGAYEKKPGLLNKLIRFDTFLIGLQYLSLAIKGTPYMGVGRNLSYKTPLFFRNKGFGTHAHIASGDDDLFIGKVATTQNTEVEVCPNSQTISRPKTSFMEWARQKRRHMTTGNLYKTRTKVVLGVFGISNVLFIGSFVALVLMKFSINLILIVFVIKVLIQLFIFRKSMDRLGEKDLMAFAPFLELFLMFFYPYIILTNRFYKQNRWK